MSERERGTPKQSEDSVEASANEVSARGATGELDLFQFLLLLRRNLRLIVGFAVAGFGLMLVVALVSTPMFSSTAVLIMPQKERSLGSLGSQLPNLGVIDLGGGGDVQVYTDILKSQTVANRLIEKYQLEQVYHTKTMDNTRAVLLSRSSIEMEREGLIRVTVRDTDRQRAADLANSYVETLDALNQELAITSAGQKRAYFEREMVKEKNALADAEVELAKIQKQTGLVLPQGQTVAQIAAVENVRAELRAREIELEGLRQSATPENPEVVRLNSEIEGLRRQLASMEKSAAQPAANGPSLAKMPDQTLEYVRKERDVKFHESLVNLLQGEYEKAKESESDEVSTIQVLDKAHPADHKSWPPRTIFVALGLVGGGILGICFAALAAIVKNALRNPANQRRMREILR